MTEQVNLPFNASVPVLAAWGAGVDSTAMLIEMVENGERVDHVLFADTGSEKPETYLFIPIFVTWLRTRGVPVSIVRYKPTKKLKHFPGYSSLDENCITNTTLPSISFGMKGCSQKWKIEPQNKWTRNWEPARKAWAAGKKVVKLIGYDCSAKDIRRYAHRETGDAQDKLYSYRYPLREWGWDRDSCAERILQAGLPVPPKSACYMCLSTQPAELHDMQPHLLRRIVLIEAQAERRNEKVDGLWRHGIKGCRGAVQRPGSMTEYIEQTGLLPQEEIDHIASIAPDVCGSWRELFDAANAGMFDPGITPGLYQAARSA
jgi:hypothetical protein